MKHNIILALILISTFGYAQNWVDTIFNIETIANLEYGMSVDFKGEMYSLKLDISFPVDDTPPVCGRPLMVVVHGGAWFTGDKNEGYPIRLQEDFLKEDT